MAPFCRHPRKNRKRADPEANRINEIRDLKRQGGSARIDFEQKRTEKAEDFFPSFSLLLSVVAANSPVLGKEPWKIRSWPRSSRRLPICWTFRERIPF